MLELEIEALPGSLIRDLEQLRDRDIAFVIARALTRTAHEAREAIQRSMPRRFTLRSQRAITGVRALGADYKSGDPVAKVMDIDPWMKLQEEGGTKRPRRSDRLAVPQEAEISRTGTGAVKPSSKPGALKKLGRVGWKKGAKRAKVGSARSRTRYFYAQFNSGRMALVKSSGKVDGKRRVRRGKRLRAVKILGRQLTVVYALPRTATIEARFGFVDTASLVAQHRFPHHLSGSLQEQLRERGLA